MTNLPTKPASTSILSQTVHDRALIDLAASFANRLVKEADGTFWLEVMPTAAQHRSIIERRDAVHRTLRPASMSDADKKRISDAVMLALSGWINAKSGNPAASVAAYVLHLQDLPAFAVEKACQDIGRGMVEGLSPDFPPSAARIHQLASEEIETLNAEAINIGHVLGARKIEAHSVEVDENMRAVTKAWLDRSDPKAQTMLNPPEESPLDAAHHARAADLAARSAAITGRRPSAPRDLTPSPWLVAYGRRHAEEMAQHADLRERERRLAAGEATDA